jgi:hypothetical protein
MFSKRFVAASAVAVPSLVSSPGQPPASLKIFTSVFSTDRPNGAGSKARPAYRTPDGPAKKPVDTAGPASGLQA